LYFIIFSGFLEVGRQKFKKFPARENSEKWRLPAEASAHTGSHAADNFKFFFGGKF